MLAYRVTRFGAEPELLDVPIPEPGPGEVLVRVGGAGACHSDLHVMAGRVKSEPPFTLGHENAGWVATLGAGVTGIAEGDPVAVYTVWGCGVCAACRTSAENHCVTLGPGSAYGGGFGPDGGMAEFMLVPHARSLIPLGDLDPAAAAPLTDAALTPYHAIKRALPLLGPGTTAAVIGLGGLGHTALQLLGLLSPARLVAVDRDERRLAAARELGCDAAVVPDDGTSAVTEVSRGVGAQLVLDFVGVDETLALAVAMAARDSDVVIVGLGGGSLPFRFGALPFGARLRTPFCGTGLELRELVALAQDGLIEVPIERFPLTRAAEAYERLRAGTLEGRAVIEPEE
jgi:propanol-preferring alcohol dehydrogenase